MASPGERPVAEVAGFLKHQHLHLKVQAAAFRFFAPGGCTSVLCFLGLRGICSDEVLHLSFLIPRSPRLLIKTALASAAEDKQDPHREEDHGKHQSPNSQGLVVIMKRVLFFLLLSGTGQDRWGQEATQEEQHHFHGVRQLHKHQLKGTSQMQEMLDIRALLQIREGEAQGYVTCPRPRS